MSHGIEVTKLPKGFELIASTDNCPIAGFAHNAKNYFGLQFHPEVTHTKEGNAVLENFVEQSVIVKLAGLLKILLIIY